MKKIKEFVQYIYLKIKKNFLNDGKPEVYQGCKEAFVFNQLTKEFDEETEEYFVNYTSTTRWQTV